MKKGNSLIGKLIKAKTENNGVVTFYFEDNTSRSQDINKEVFLDEKNKELPLYKVIQKFNDIAHDIGAKRFEID